MTDENVIITARLPQDSKSTQIEVLRQEKVSLLPYFVGSDFIQTNTLVYSQVVQLQFAFVF